MAVRERIDSRVKKIQDGAKAKTKLSGWVLPKHASKFGGADIWWVILKIKTATRHKVNKFKLSFRVNIDTDVTPIERQTWTAWTMFGFWFSDAMNAQSWEAPSAILAAGLTWWVFLHIHTIQKHHLLLPMLSNTHFVQA